MNLIMRKFLIMAVFALLTGFTAIPLQAQNALLRYAENSMNWGTSAMRHHFMSRPTTASRIMKMPKKPLWPTKTSRNMTKALIGGKRQSVMRKLLEKTF